MNIVKESLAKLLAQEDLIVEHRQVSTAQFNVETRVLTLPTWSHKENAVVDALIAHEVGHALYTPNEWDFIKEIPMQFVNVVEDIRIEMQMKRRYPGLSKTFYKGYQILSDEDFFKIEGEDISEFNIVVTGSYGGCWVSIPDNSGWTTGLSDTNGWANMFTAYSGSGVPRNAAPGCASGSVMSGSSGTFKCVFGTESSSNATSPYRILIRWRLDAGDSITAMSYTTT